MSLLLVGEVACRPVSWPGGAEVMDGWMDEWDGGR